MMKYALVVTLFTVQALGQLSGNAQLVLFPGTPTGSCTSRQLGLNQSNSTLYVCNNSAWQLETPSGGGGGGGLLGCSTSTSGQLVCDVSVQGGTGPVGMLTLPFAQSGLPAPPSGDLAAVAANATGQLYWSPGGSSPFVPFGTGGGGQPTGTATALQFNQTTLNLSSTAPATGECLALHQDGTIAGVTCGGAVAGPTLGGVTIIE